MDLDLEKHPCMKKIFKLLFGNVVMILGSQFGPILQVANRQIGMSVQGVMNRRPLCMLFTINRLSLYLYPLEHYVCVWYLAIVASQR